MNNHQRSMLLLGLLASSAVALGCASNDRRVSDDERRSEARSNARDNAVLARNADLERARASIADAERAGAAQFGNAELTLAREKLRAAEDAIEDGDAERGQQLAVEADLDAALATAITRNHETQEAVTEVRAGLRTLEEELRRSETDLPRP